MAKGERAAGSKKLLRTEGGADVWRLKYDVPPVPPKTRTQLTATFRGTARQADLELARLIEEAWGGGPTLDKKTTLGDYLVKEWLPHYKRRRRPKSYETRETAVRKHIVPHLGHVALIGLRPRAIQKWVDAQEDKGFAPATVRLMVDTLRLALNQAVAWELIDRNPAAALELPDPGERVARSWTVAETRAFLGHPVARRNLCLWVVIANAQLRRGEAAGLLWEDVDFERGLIVVRRQGQQRRGGGFDLAEPKTPKSTRVLPMAAAVMKMLEAHKADQARRRAELTDLGVWGADAPKLGMKPVYERGEDGSLAIPVLVRARHHPVTIREVQTPCPGTTEGSLPDWVFDRGDGAPLTPWTIWVRFRAACAAAGVPPIRLHDMRHVGLTLMGEAGVPESVLRDRAGHTNVKTTQGYLHPSVEIQRVGAELLADALGLGGDDIVVDERPAT